jgi:tRNA(adenine34) deaminase
LQEKHEYYMALALMEAKAALLFGEVPIGAIIVCQDQIIARAHNWRETWKDPTAHAELIAIQSASRKLGGWRLSDCDLYVTLEPCLMCAGSILLSRLARVYFGAFDPKGGAISSRMEVLVEGLWNHQPEIRGGILGDECGMILKDFFRQLRR